MPEEATATPESWVIVATFFLSLLAFTGVGILSSRKKQSTTRDYLLASRSVSPWLMALSTVATINSGFMFVGMIGFTYRDGLHSLWMLVGWTMGDYLAWRLVYGRLRALSQERDEISVLALLEPRGRRGILVLLAGCLTIFYLAMYAAAQLKAGSVALTSIFDMHPGTGAIIGAGIVVIYCFSGGIRASIWTDAAQSIVMMSSMLILVGVASWKVGGPSALMSGLESIEPGLVELFPEPLDRGFIPYLLGMTLGGFGVIGQPHILVRSLCIDDVSSITRARRYYFLWLIPFYALAVIAGLHARVILPDLGQAGGLASEQALAALSLELLPPVLIGVILAGLFSATMSTADSLVIACSSAVTQDLRPAWKDSYRASKISTLTVTLLALGIALFSADGVFDLVLDAWAVMSCSLGPLILIAIFGWPPERPGSAILLITGATFTNLWLLARSLEWIDPDSLLGSIYVNLPGMIAVFLVYALILVARKFAPADPDSTTHSPQTRQKP